MGGIRLLALDGSNSIGGSKILIRYDKNQVLLDFGTSFSKVNRYYEEFLKPRSAGGLLDFVAMGILPDAINLYREDLIHPEMQLIGEKIGKIDAMILSHAHADHFGDMGFLRTDIPVITSAMTVAMVKGISESSKSDLGRDYISPSLREQSIIRDMAVINTCTTKSLGDRDPRGRDFIINNGKVTSELAGFWRFSPAIEMSDSPKRCKPHTPGQLSNRLDHIDCRSMPVDHSVKGATANIIGTDQGNIIYTGDLRMHGMDKSNTEEFIRIARSPRPRVLIIEGTRAGRASDESQGIGYVSESDVLNNVRNLISGMAGEIVIADFGPRNIERLEIFLKAAIENHRKMVVTTKDAYLLRAMNTVDESIPVPSSDMLVYDCPKGSEQKFEDYILTKAYPGSTVNGRAISKSPGDYVIAFSFFDLKHIIDIKPSSGHYIYSSCEAFSEEQEVDFVRMGAWFRKFNLKQYGFTFDNDGKPVFDKGPNSLHASGHATKEDLVKIVEAIDPEVVVPVHTTNPEWFVENFAGQRKVVLLEEGKWANV